MDCIHSRTCKELHRLNLILNITSLRYRTAKEIYTLMKEKDESISEPTLRGMLTWMVENEHLDIRARVSKNRGMDPMEYRNMSMLRKSGG